MEKSFFFTFLFFLSACIASAQENRESDPESRLKEYSLHYLESAGGEAAVYSGKVQQAVNRRTESLYLRERGTPFRSEWGNPIHPEPLLAHDSYSAGTLLYDGVFYRDVHLRLDLHRDELVILTPNRISGIILEPERVGYADLRGYRNIHIRPGDPAYGLSPGYYQILYSGDRQVLRKETFQYNLSENTFVNWNIRYYIEKEGDYHRVARKGQVLKILREHRRELNRLLREHGIVFRENPEAAIEFLVSRYDALNRKAGL